jgi:hypothetical protein
MHFFHDFHGHGAIRSRPCLRMQVPAKWPHIVAAAYRSPHAVACFPPASAASPRRSSRARDRHVPLEKKDGGREHVHVLSQRRLLLRLPLQLHAFQLVGEQTLAYHVYAHQNPRAAASVWLAHVEPALADAFHAVVVEQETGARFAWNIKGTCVTTVQLNSHPTSHGLHSRLCACLHSVLCVRSDVHSVTFIEGEQRGNNIEAKFGTCCK